MSSEYRERYTGYQSEDAAEFNDEDRRVLAGRVSGEIWTEHHEAVGRDHLSEAELHFNVTEDNGREIHAAYRYMVMETEPPKLKEGDTIELHGGMSGDYFEVNTWSKETGKPR